jgi:signal transduction histidine kinase
VRVHTDEELRLQAALRDLVALSAIPAMWIGREPAAVATGLADALVAMLDLDFAYVRLSDPGGAGAVDVTRGSAWEEFPEWLERHLAASVPFPGKEIITDVGNGSASFNGVAVPIGFKGEDGVVVAACERPDFPSAVDQLLLSLAANHAATAFQNARLIDARRSAEEEVRRARDDLEVKVTERTAELERSRAELAASRARIVTAADETRRRIERDLHDGVQQQLIAARMELSGIEAAMPPADERRDQLAHAAMGLAGAQEDLVEISRGIHPGALAEGGLGPAIKTLARRSPVPVEVELRTETRLPAPLEVAAYYIVSEALTNTAKHAEASAAQVVVEARAGVLDLSIHDDGRGGADASRGSGLIGLADRIDALGGTLDVASPIGGGTTLRVRLPIRGA